MVHRRRLIGESSPVASNPEPAGDHTWSAGGAKLLGWRFKTLDANLSPGKQVSDVDTFINLKASRHRHLDARSRRGRRRVQARAERGHSDHGLRIHPERHDRGLRRAQLQVQHGERGSDVHLVADPAGEGARDRRAARAVDHRLHQLLHQRGEGRGLTIVERQDNVKDTATTAQPIVQDLLTKHPDTQAIWAYNDPSALGAGAVVRSSGKDIWVQGKQEGVIIIGANGSKDAAAAIKRAS